MAAKRGLNRSRCSAALFDLPRFAEERRARLLDMLRQRGRMEVLELARVFGVSEHTIRRDLNQLHAEGVLQKTHGGAVMLDSARLGFEARTALLERAKGGIGKTAATLIEPGSTVILDAGSTTLALARALTARPLSVVTNSLDIAVLFDRDPAVQLVLTGGTWTPDARALRGTAAREMLALCRADWAVLGACALDVRAGVTASYEDDAAVKRAMVAAASRTMVLAKQGSVAPFHVAAWQQVSLLMTDVHWAEVAQLGVDVRLASAAG
jgi:DeoR/GlpR family transcriptional regulator of sugar metabolism